MIKRPCMISYFLSHTHTPQKHLYLFIYLFERKRERASERESFHLLAYFPKAIMMRVRQQPGARISQAGGRNPSTWAITTISWVYIRRKLESEADTGVQIQELQDEMLASKPASSLLSLKFTFQLHLPQTFQSPSVILDCSASPFFSSGQCKQSYHLLHRELSQPAASTSLTAPGFPGLPAPLRVLTVFWKQRRPGCLGWRFQRQMTCVFSSPFVQRAYSSDLNKQFRKLSIV